VQWSVRIINGVRWPEHLRLIYVDKMLTFTGYYAFWCASWFGLVFNYTFTARRYAFALGKEIHLTFVTASSWILLLWMCYPICWGISEGGNVIAPDSEFIFYGILDCCLIPVSSALLLWGHRNVDPRRLGLYMRDYDDPIPGYGSIMHDEKARGATESGLTPGNTNGVTDGAAAAAV